MASYDENVSLFMDMSEGLSRAFSTFSNYTLDLDVFNPERIILVILVPVS